MTVQTDLCDCGTPVTRELPDDDSKLSQLIRDLKPVCAECTEAQRLADLAKKEEEQREDRRAMRFYRLDQSGLPAKYHGLRVRELDHPSSVLDPVEDWAEHGGGLLLTGDIGRGKTSLAGAAAWQRLDQRPVIWTSAPLLFARLGSGLGSEQRNWALDTLANTKGLVLDDIDKARPTEYGAEQVFLAVDQRVEHEAPLLVTSNLSPAKLAEHWPEPYGPAIASRLVGYCKVVRIDGEDRRLSR